MSDLISRSEAIQRLIQETIDSKNNLIHINTVKRLLQDVDTAYDVDKVVEQIYDGIFVYDIPKDIVTEIVRKGGV